MVFTFSATDHGRSRRYPSRNVPQVRRAEDDAVSQDSLCTSNCLSSRTCRTKDNSCLCSVDDNQRILFCLQTSCLANAASQFQASIDRTCSSQAAPTSSKTAAPSTSSKSARTTRRRSSSLTASAIAGNSSSVASSTTSQLDDSLAPKPTRSLNSTSSRTTASLPLSTTSLTSSTSSSSSRVVFTSSKLSSNSSTFSSTESTQSTSTSNASDVIPHNFLPDQSKHDPLPIATTLGIVAGVVGFLVIATAAIWIIYRRRQSKNEGRLVYGQTMSQTSSEAEFTEKKLAGNAQTHDSQSWIDFALGEPLPAQEKGEGARMTNSKGEKLEDTPQVAAYTETFEPSQEKPAAPGVTIMRSSQRSFLNFFDSGRTDSMVESVRSKSVISTVSAHLSKLMPKWIDVNQVSHPPSSTQHHHQRKASDTPSSIFTPGNFLNSHQQAGAVHRSIIDRPPYQRTRSGMTSYFSRLLGEEGEGQRVKRKPVPKRTTAEIKQEQQDLHSEIVRLTSAPLQAGLNAHMLRQDSSADDKNTRQSSSVDTKTHSGVSYPRDVSMAASEDGEWHAAPTRASSIDLQWVTQPPLPTKHRQSRQDSQFLVPGKRYVTPSRSSSHKSGVSNQMPFINDDEVAEPSPALPSNGSSRRHSSRGGHTAGSTHVGRAL